MSNKSYAFSNTPQASATPLTSPGTPPTSLSDRFSDVEDELLLDFKVDMLALRAIVVNRFQREAPIVEETSLLIGAFARPTVFTLSSGRKVVALLFIPEKRVGADTAAEVTAMHLATGKFSFQMHNYRS